MKRQHLFYAVALAALGFGCGSQDPSSDPSSGKGELAGKIKAAGDQATVTQTVTITQTVTDSQTSTGTATATATGTATQTQSGPGTLTTTPTRTATATVTGTYTRTSTSTATATATQTQGGVLSYNQIYVVTGTVTSTNTATVYYAQWAHTKGNTATATSSQYILTTAGRAATATVTSTFNGTETKTVIATMTGSGTSTGTTTVTVTATMTSTSSNAGGGSRTVTATGTATGTAIQSWTYHQTATVTQTVTKTATGTLTGTNTITTTLTSTITPTVVSTGTTTVTGTNTVTKTLTNTSSRTVTSTATQTSTGLDYGSDCTANANCASGSCSPTMHKCQVATIDCNSGSYQLHPFTSLLAVPGTTCPAGLLVAWSLHDTAGTCCVNWGPGSCFDDDNSPCAAGQVCAGQFCKNDFNQPCTTNADCASGDCSATVHKCEIASLDCNNGRYEGHDFTSMFAVPTGFPCPVGLLNVWPLGAGDGTCCANWGPGSCFNGDSTPCADNQICSGATCTADYGAACTQDADCASGSCSATVHKCQVPANDCNSGSYQGNAFTSLLSVPPGVSCPSNLLPAWELGLKNGTCCVSWGADSCLFGDDARCGAGKACSEVGHCKSAMGEACTADSDCASDACSPTTHKCQVKTIDCDHGSYQLHPFTSLQAVPGPTCPAGLLPAWTLHDATGICCVNWGQGSCMDSDNTPCGPNGQCVAQFCKGDYGFDCTGDSQCVSGSCSPTMHKCQVPTTDCNNGSYELHPFTSLISVPAGAACPTGLLTAWTLHDAAGTCCANWGPGSCMNDDASMCGPGGACVNQFCKAGNGVACTQNSDCASGSCSPTAHKCQVATIDCNSGSYQGNAFTSMLAVGAGESCPSDMLTAWALHDVAGTCCANWGPGSCFDDDSPSRCPAGQQCQMGLCRGNLGAACWNRTECASRDCSLTAHMCEITSTDCWNGSYETHPFTSMLSLPTGSSCPAGMFEAWPLSDVAGICCANWGAGSCHTDSDCSAGKLCSGGLCKLDYGATCFSDSACASGSCSPTAHECQVATIDCDHGSYQLHPFTTLLAVPGATCPTGLLVAWPLHDATGTCCVNWGPGSCMDGDSSPCAPGQTCVNQFCQ
jgi:hypothetical protein